MKPVPTTATLECLRLVQSEYCALPNFYSASEFTLELSTKWDSVKYFKEAKTARGICEWSVCASIHDERRLTIVARYFVAYGNLESPADEAVQFLRDVGRMAVYPYFRAHVAAICAAGELEIPILPSINIGTFAKKSKVTAHIRRVNGGEPSDSRQGQTGAALPSKELE